MADSTSSLVERVERILGDVARAAERSGRDRSSVTAVGVCKTVGRDVVDQAYAAGIRHFGENRVQDAVAKFAEPLPADATLHMIGQLQTNKANVAARLFSVIESVDRLSLIVELEKQAAKLNRVIPVLLQVNIAGESQKAGCDPAESQSLLQEILMRPNLSIEGLMTIAPLVDNPEAVRHFFSGLRNLRDQLAFTCGKPLPHLSMGMSNDFAVAIEEGATLVRVGRALFHG